MWGMGLDRMVRDAFRAAERIKLPVRRRPRATVPSKPDPTAPALVRGRGLHRRRPRSPLPSLLSILILGAALLALLRFLLG